MPDPGRLPKGPKVSRRRGRSAASTQQIVTAHAEAVSALPTAVMRTDIMTDQPETPDRFVVEADRRVVGIAVRVPGGFKFFASEADFSEAAGRIFPGAKARARVFADIARRRRGGRAASPDRLD